MEIGQYTSSRQTVVLSGRKINRLYLTRVTLNSTIRLTDLWPLNSRSNWNLEMLVFEERGKPEYPEKNLSEEMDQRKKYS